jgi:hypothetical protein
MYIHYSYFGPMLRGVKDSILLEALKRVTGKG